MSWPGARTPAHSMLWICSSLFRGSWCSRGPRRSTSASARMKAAISARVRSSPSCRAALLADESSTICRMLSMPVRSESVNRDGRCCCAAAAVIRPGGKVEARARAGSGSSSGYRWLRTELVATGGVAPLVRLATLGQELLPVARVAVGSVTARSARAPTPPAPAPPPPPPAPLPRMANSSSCALGRSSMRSSVRLRVQRAGSGTETGIREKISAHGQVGVMQDEESRFPGRAA